VYLEKLKGPHSAELEAYERENAEGEERQKILHQAYLDLEKLYQSAVSDSEKTARKQELLAALRNRLQMKREINNATLIQFKEYHTGKRDFEELFEACGRDWKRFLGALSKLSEKSFSKGQQQELAPVLAPVVQGRCS
jgi:predicted aminopeptidase